MCFPGGRRSRVVRRRPLVDCHPLAGSPSRAIDGWVKLAVRIPGPDLTPPSTKSLLLATYAKAIRGSGHHQSTIATKAGGAARDRLRHLLPVASGNYLGAPYSGPFKSDVSQSDMFLPFAPMLVGMHVLVATAGSVPRIDIEKTCRASEKTIKRVFGDSGISNVFESCMASEKATLQQLIKDWGTYPAAAKLRCVQPSVYMPNYTEWITCLEMERDVRKMRLENPNPSVPVQPRSRRQRSG